MSQNKNTPKQVEKAIQCGQVEELLVRGYATSTIVKRCRKEWGCSAQTVYHRVQDVRDAWREEAMKYDRTAVRDAHRARLLRCYNLAVNRRVPMRDGEGNPVINKTTNRPYLVEEPDLRTASKFMDQLSKLDALNEEGPKDTNAAKDLVTLMAMASVKNERAKQLGIDQN